jgi:ATP phosphoribosyltransferase
MLGLPKGSLEESTKSLFAKAGWKITTSSRSYKPSIDDPELDGRFIRAQEISRYVEHGFFDCGLTGYDWIKENESDVVEVCDLIYSKASAQKSRWVLCVPEASPIRNPRSWRANASPPSSSARCGAISRRRKSGRGGVFLGRHRDQGARPGRRHRRHHRDRVRFARTSFASSTRCSRPTPSSSPTRPAGPIPPSGEDRDHRAAAQGRARGGEQGRPEDEPAQGGPRSDLQAALPALRNPTISPLSSPDWIALETIIDESVVREIIPQLKALGAEGIVEYPLNKVVIIEGPARSSRLRLPSPRHRHGPCHPRTPPARLLCRSGGEPEEGARARRTRRPGRARRSSARRSCFARSISARARTTRISSWPSRSPARARGLPEAGEATPRRGHRLALRAARAGLYHNTAAIIDADGSLLGIYRKMHIPDDPLYYEKFYFTPGDTGFRAWQTRYGKIGVLICWDQWYPEAARLTALQGAEIIFYPTAIGWHPAEKNTAAPSSTTPGKPSSAPTPWPTAATWRCATASATRRRRAATASSSGARVSWPARREDPGQGRRRPGGNRPRAG